jgi:hypothetical protein
MLTVFKCPQKLCQEREAVDDGGLNCGRRPNACGYRAHRQLRNAAFAETGDSGPQMRSIDFKSTCRRLLLLNFRRSRGDETEDGQRSIAKGWSGRSQRQDRVKLQDPESIEDLKLRRMTRDVSRDSSHPRQAAYLTRFGPGTASSGVDQILWLLSSKESYSVLCVDPLV